MNIRTREELANYVNRGKKVKYLFFWGHQAKGSIIQRVALVSGIPPHLTKAEIDLQQLSTT